MAYLKHMVIIDQKLITYILEIKRKEFKHNVTEIQETKTKRKEQRTNNLIRK